MGFQVVDQLAETSHILLTVKRFKLLYGRGTIDSHAVILAKPVTYMNQSGEAVREAVRFLRLPTEDLIIVHDDIDLPLGQLRFKRSGGDGGHQGVRSVIEALGEYAFYRLKVGVGRPPVGVDPAEYVLTAFPTLERAGLKGVVARAAEAVRVLLLDGMATAMNRYHQKDSG